MTLYGILKSKVIEWRNNNYQSNYLPISEIFEFNLDQETGKLRFLRKAQFEALETYWYLRLVERTPHIFDLYKRLYDDPVELFKALNIVISQEDLIKVMTKGGIDSVFEKIKGNGNTFHIVYSDVPEKKNDLVKGKYEIEIPEKKTKVIIKIIDMLGEEVINVFEV